ncbi:MAG: 2-amino-4-hydroxy-6-hydroxymethyldihydropteridine diphosphokinase [Bacteroidetes bacterium]|nr:2-amino-4-hydroxy-6-hydroxymethyldihydropteridine diphosphokinase [Bacteroidota bacterium]
MNLVYLLTGSNLGDRIENLNKAAQLINEKAGKLMACSKFYQTSPWGPLEQPDYINQALLIETPLSPSSLMERLLSLEEKIGRIRTLKYGPRVIDIDILYYGSEVINTPLVQVPHPAVQNRRFALIPLEEIAPNYIDPITGKTISQLLAVCQDMGTVLQLN